MHLRDWMRQHGVTQQELARRLHPPVSQAKVSHWLQGSRRVDLHSALQLVEITGGAVTVEELAELSRPRQGSKGHGRSPRSDELQGDADDEALPETVRPLNLPTDLRGTAPRPDTYLNEGAADLMLPTPVERRA